MAKNFVQNGSTIEFVADKDVLSGELVVIGEIVGVAHENVATGETGVAHTSGVFSFEKPANSVFEVGRSVFILDGELTEDNTAVYVGKAWSFGGAFPTFDVNINYGAAGFSTADEEAGV
ncbi:MAG: capsid cement protein [Vibrio sp.]